MDCLIASVDVPLVLERKDNVIFSMIPFHSHFSDSPTAKVIDLLNKSVYCLHIFDKINVMNTNILWFLKSSLKVL